MEACCPAALLRPRAGLYGTRPQPRAALGARGNRRGRIVCRVVSCRQLHPKFPRCCLARTNRSLVSVGSETANDFPIRLAARGFSGSLVPTRTNHSSPARPARRRPPANVIHGSSVCPDHKMPSPSDRTALFQGRVAITNPPPLHPAPSTQHQQSQLHPVADWRPCHRRAALLHCCLQHRK